MSSQFFTLAADGKSVSGVWDWANKDKTQAWIRNGAWKGGFKDGVLVRLVVSDSHKGEKIENGCIVIEDPRLDSIEGGYGDYNEAIDEAERILGLHLEGENNEV